MVVEMEVEVVAVLVVVIDVVDGVRRSQTSGRTEAVVKSNFEKHWNKNKKLDD